MAGFTPALLASLRHRYENTDEDVRVIAAHHGISDRTLYRLRKEGAWAKRRTQRRRDLPPAMRLLEEARALTEAQTGPAGDPGTPAAPPFAAPDSAATIDRIQRLVEQELTAEEAVRAQLGTLPRRPVEAERAARTLSTLTQTLHALARLRCGIAPNSGSNDDDMPEDIDEFRRDLARRIDAFVASRTDAGDADGHPAAATVDEVR